MSTSPLHPDDVNIITAQVVSLAQADLPLETGLRAAAAESSNARIAKVLARIATKLEAGESLEQAINSVAGALPGNVSALLLAGKQTGKWREALLDVVEHDLSSQETLRTVRSALAYPLALIGFAYCCFLFLQFTIVGNFSSLMADFELDLPRSTTLLFQINALGWWLVIIPSAIVFLVGVVLPRCLGNVRWHRLLATVPFAGPMWHWCGVAQGTRALSYLVDQQVPLSTALRLASNGLRDANIAEVWQLLAECIDRGQLLSDAIWENYRVPASLAPLVAWGERSHALGEALRSASDMLEGRVRLRAQMLRVVLPPLLFVMIGCGAFFIVSALLGPLVSLVTNLSG